jgi:hypothetical protein
VHRRPAPQPKRRLPFRPARHLPKPRRMPPNLRRQRKQRRRMSTTPPGASATRNLAVPSRRARAPRMFSPVMFASLRARNLVKSMSRECAPIRTRRSRSPCVASSLRWFARIIPPKGRGRSRKRRPPQVERRHMRRPTQSRKRSQSRIPKPSRTRRTAVVWGSLTCRGRRPSSRAGT